jgi:hypothetical protein
MTRFAGAGMVKVRQALGEVIKAIHRRRVAA